jgi:hypothetical protein
MKMQKFVAVVALAGAITVGTAGMAFAADSTGSGTAAATAPAVKRHPVIRREIRRAGVKIVITTLGVTRADLGAALKSGKSISEYATSLGKDPQSVVSALVTAADAKVDQLVANKTITAERGATIKSKVPDRVNTIVNRHFGQAAQPAS